jgi:hypothetical protein
MVPIVTKEGEVYNAALIHTIKEMIHKGYNYVLFDSDLQLLVEIICSEHKIMSLLLLLLILIISFYQRLEL